MRSYVKAFRTKDFKTYVNIIPAGADFSNYEKVALMVHLFSQKPALLDLLNRFTAVQEWQGFPYGYDMSGPISQATDSFSGIGLANLIPVFPYQDHPLN